MKTLWKIALAIAVVVALLVWRRAHDPATACGAYIDRTDQCLNETAKKTGMKTTFGGARSSFVDTCKMMLGGDGPAQQAFTRQVDCARSTDTCEAFQTCVGDALTAPSR
jgi:hypothetical protein